MKRYLLFVALIGFAMTTICGCGEKKITVKGVDGTEYESYQECCAAQDFQAAHQFLAKMKNAIAEKDEDKKYDAERELESATEEVFKKEALFLMSQGDEDSKQRILYLLKEEGGNDSQVDMLMDLAIDNDDEAFVKTLTKQYKSSISSQVLRKLVEYLYIQKGEGNLEFVTTLLNHYNEFGMLLDAAIEKGDEDLVVNLAKQYSSYLSFQSFKNVLDFLELRNNNNYKALFNTLASVVLENNTKELNIITKGIHEDDISVKGPKCNEAISAYNQHCIKVLHKAIEYKQLNIANRVIRLMKPNIVTHTGNTGNPKVDGVVVGYGKFYAQYVNTEINEAKGILNDAVRSGAFR